MCSEYAHSHKKMTEFGIWAILMFLVPAAILYWTSGNVEKKEFQVTVKLHQYFPI